MADNPMFDRYTDRARRVLVIAQDEARNLGHAHIGAAHLLLGLIGEDGGVAAQALKSLGNATEMLVDARRVASRTYDRTPATPAESLPFTQRLTMVLDMAVHEAMTLGNNYIATEHLLLALAAGSAPGASPLVAIGVNPDDAREKVMKLLHGYEAAGKRPTAPEPDVVAGDRLSSALEEIRERERKASPGPWEADVEHGYDMDGEPFTFDAVVGPDGQMALETLADLRFAAHAREDVPRLLAALDAVLAAHRNADGRCAWCRNPDGQRQKWPCGEYQAITRELTGKGAPDGQ